jgi:predicted ATPase
MLGESACADAVSEWVVRCIGGNPFFIEQTLKHLIDRGVLKRTCARWHLDELALARLGVPATIAGVIVSRFSGLTCAASKIKDVIAVLGRAAKLSLIREVLSTSEDDLVDALKELTDRHLVVGWADSAVLSKTARFRKAVADSIGFTDLIQGTRC